MSGRRLGAVTTSLVFVAVSWQQTGSAQAAPARSPRHHHHHACTVRAGYQLTDSWVAGQRIAHLDVRFRSTCGHTVRAFYEHDSASGSTTEVGRAVSRPRSKSSVLSRDPSFCRLGWEQRRGHHWRQRVLRTNGSC